MRRVYLLFILTLSSVLLAGCQGSPTFLQPYSFVSARESSLYWIVFYMGMGVFAFVWLMLIYNIVRFRRRKSDSDVEPRQKYGNWRLEFVWTAIPVLLVLILFVLTVTTINATAAPSKQPTDINVNVIGHQWWWEFKYPDLGFTTANELHVPLGANIHLTLNSVDVIHSFWVPQLSGKMDVIPGQTNHLWFRVDQPAVYGGQCAEFCGLNHANMRIKVVAEPADQFSTWVKGQQAPVYAPASDLEKKGHDMITKGICANCHTLGDHQANNPIGPNLNHLMSRSVFAGATFELNSDNLQNWLKDSQAMKPGNDMIVNLNQDDIQALMAYLTKLK